MDWHVQYILQWVCWGVPFLNIFASKVSDKNKGKVSQFFGQSVTNDTSTPGWVPLLLMMVSLMIGFCALLIDHVCGFCSTRVILDHSVRRFAAQSERELKCVGTRVSFRALCLKFRAKPARNCPKLFLRIYIVKIILCQLKLTN